ncbi:MAG: hypothetical protein SFZ03_12320 [Candidatus Melainabacteria bacterium]|nr:hypothetical protein [Candidatus Melainabacteria bacterium]
MTPPLDTTNAPDPSTRRWYDHDPVLIEVLDLLKSFQADVRIQAQDFINKIEAAVGPETLKQFYATAERTARPKGNRWYDQDPVVSKAVELLRVVPPDAQRQAALRFLESMKRHGVTSP